MVYKKLLEFEEDLNAAAKKNTQDDDSGYELDDSGMIPKLEELKAAGKSEKTEKESGILMNSSEVFSYEDLHKSEEDFTTEEYDDFLFADDDDEQSPLEQDFQRSMIIEKDSLPEEEDEFEQMYDFEALDHLDDDDNSLDTLKVFDKDDFSSREVKNSYDMEDDGFLMDEEDYDDELDDFDDIEDDLSDLKINFYDDADNSDGNQEILEALYKIGDKSEIVEILENIADKTEIVDAIDRIADKDEMSDVLDAVSFNTDRFLDTLDRIADSLERIADTLELKE